MDQAIDWEFAARVAQRAAGIEPLAQSYLYDSLHDDFASATVLAEELVAAETGLRSLDGPARARVIGRSEWIDANIKSFRRLLRPLTDKLTEKTEGGPMATISSKVAAVELGSVLGWMSRRVLGQYDLLLAEDEDPHDQDLVYYVGPNVLAIEKRYAFVPEEFRLWLATHELTHRAQFTGVPWMREHFIGLVERTLDNVDPDPDRIMSGLKRLFDERRRGETTALDSGLALLFASDEQRQVLDEVSGLMSLLEGHGDTTMNRAARDHVPSVDRFAKVMQQRRSQSKGLARIMQKLIGIDAKLAQYEQGERFIEHIEAERGDRAVDVIWSDVSLLPSMDEIKEPSQWLLRVPTQT
ncbi:MAG: hypothetical protein GY708_25500 [Actinomycetia bacterium]|nr:hypothetical protein [Actinomycetes bacterium]